jgi:spermidine synthase
VRGALDAVFPVVRTTPGPDSLFVAGFEATAVTLDPGVLAERFRSRDLSAAAFAPELFPLLLEPGNVSRLEAALGDAARRVDPSRDDRPVSLLFALSRRHLETASPVGRALGALGALPPSVLVAVALLAPFALAVRGLVAPVAAGRAARSGAAATGAAGMALSFLLLLSYQTREGSLYGALGALTASFMLGLASGAAAAGRVVAARAASPRLLVTSLLGAGGAFAAIALALPALGRLGAPTPAAAFGVHAALLLAAGAATGALFPVATGVLLAETGDPGTAAASFEAADHLGGAAAALLSGVVLVPALGIATTGLLAVPVVLLAAAGAARAR